MTYALSGGGHHHGGHHHGGGGGRRWGGGGYPVFVDSWPRYAVIEEESIDAKCPCGWKKPFPDSRVECVPCKPAMSGLGLSIPGTSIDTTKIANGLVSDVKTALTPYLTSFVKENVVPAVKAEIPGLVAQFGPVIKKEATNFIAELPENPNVKRVKKQLMFAMAAQAVFILVGMYIIEKKVGR